MKKIFKISLNKLNVAKISSGTMIGQLLTVISLPFLAQLYGPTVIGNWALIYAFAVIINSFSDLGLRNSIMVVLDEKVEKNYLVISTVSVFISFFSALIVALYIFLFSNITQNIFFVFTFLFLFIFTKQQVQICYTWLNRIGKYNILAVNPIINNGIAAIISISLGLLGYLEYGYFIGHLVGLLITLIHMKRFLPAQLFTINFSEIKERIFEQKIYLKYQMPANVLSNFKNQLPTLLISGLWGQEILGYYSITVKLLQIPSTALASAIGRVFFNITSSMKRQGKEIGPYVLKNLNKGMIIAIIPIGVLMAYGDFLIIHFLGDDWEIAGEFIKILSLQYFFMFLTNTIQGLPTILEKQQYAMYSVFFQIIGYSTGALIGKYIFNDIFIALVLMSAFFIVLNVIYYLALLKSMGVSGKKYFYNVLISVFLIFTLSYLLQALRIFLI